MFFLISKESLRDAAKSNSDDEKIMLKVIISDENRQVLRHADANLLDKKARHTALAATTTALTNESDWKCYYCWQL